MSDLILNDERYNRCIEDIGELLQKTVRGFQMFEKEQIRVHGFTHSQCYILLEIFKHGSLTINEISATMKLEASTITRIMDNLVRDHLLIRQRSTLDKRIVEAILTEQGQAAAIRLEASIKMYYRNVITNLPRGHVREIMSAVEALLGALEKAK